MLILHHYPSSPFSEKIRLILGLKRLDWRSVEIPMIMPKPDVIALTGGYRKTPLLQVGADVYCDTALIARVLEARQPEPTLYPAAAPLAPLLAQWADSTLFWSCIAHTLPAGARYVMPEGTPETAKAFGADRAAFTGGMKRQTAADAAANLGRYLDAFDAQLADGRPWLFGAEATIADFSVAHGLWFVRLAPPQFALVGQRPHVAAWLERVLAVGHGRHEPMGSGEAVALARSAGGHAPAQVQPGLGFAAGQQVAVLATDYGSDPVSGRLVGLSETETVIEREDERAGVLHVHFPRAGFQLKKQETT
jgi:glutathione S-transferase